MNTTIKIDGMMCMHCVGRVEKAISAVAGVKSVEVSLEGKRAQVEFEAPASAETLEKAVEEAGYTVVK